MRLVLISDTHGQHRDLDVPDGDALIHAGDFMAGGMLEKEILDFEDWLSSLPHEHKLFIAGNHDRWMQTRLGKKALSGKHIYLEDSGCEIGGLKFYGSPWTTRFMNWAFMSERGAEMKAHWDKIPDSTDVLITHGPPQGILDGSPQYGQKLGCEELKLAIDRVRPRLHVFGHIHSGYGTQLAERDGAWTMCINAAQMDESYRLVNPPIVFNILGTSAA